MKKGFLWVLLCGLAGGLAGGLTPAKEDNDAMRKSGPSQM